MRNTLTSLTVLLLGGIFAAWGQAPAFTAAGVANQASLAAGTMAPGMVAVITGTNLGAAHTLPLDCEYTLPLPTNCNGVQVLVNGQAAPVANEYPTSITFQVPFTVSAPSATVQVISNASGSNLSSSVVAVPVAAVVPGLGSYYDFNQSTFHSETVLPGDTVALYGTGFGLTNPPVALGNQPSTIAPIVASATLSIAGANVPVTAAGLVPSGSPAQVLPGADEIVFTVPSGLAAGSYPMFATVGGVQTQTVQLKVGTPPLEITSISPATPTTGGAQVVTVNGTGFVSGLSVLVEPPGTSTIITISGSQIQSVTATSFQVTITFATTGNYLIAVKNPDQSTSNAFQFQVAAGTGMTVTGVNNAASGATSIESGSWVSIYGTGLAPDARPWLNSDFVGLGNNLPLSLDGVSVTIDNKPAAVSYISQTQINVQAPTVPGAGSVAVVVTNSSTSASGMVTLQPYSPAFFPFSQPAGTAAGAPVYAATLDNDDFSYVLPSGYYGASVVSRAAKPGEIIDIYGTGFGPTTPAAPAGQLVTGAPPLTDPTQLQVRIGNVLATVVYAGIVFPGEYQISVIVPSLPDGDQPVTATIAGFTTQAGLSIPIKN